MRRIMSPTLILLMVLVPSQTRAEFLWLGNWEVLERSGDGSFAADTTRSPSGLLTSRISLTASAYYPGSESPPVDEPLSSSIRISRRFSIIDAPEGQRFDVFFAWITGEVGGGPGARGVLLGNVSINGVFDVSLRNIGDFYDAGDGGPFVLGEGIYTFSARLGAGVDTSPSPSMLPGWSRPGMEIFFFTVPEPSCGLLLLSGCGLIVAVRLGGRLRSRPGGTGGLPTSVPPT